VPRVGGDQQRIDPEPLMQLPQSREHQRGVVDRGIGQDLLEVDGLAA